MNFLSIAAQLLRPNPGLLASLNPQPLPPGPPDPDRYATFFHGNLAMLNPQPLPPGPPDPEGISVARPGSAVSINPQPLPPKELLTPFLVLNGQTGFSFFHSNQQPAGVARLVAEQLR